MTAKYEPSALYTQLRHAEAEKEGLYDKRTEHLDTDGKALFINRLILEDSPYLLQHAHNPVNWYPWGEEAFETARRENKPVFLSIGYSTCHWCHVMEVESFDNVEVARLLNNHFISIKLDREQYPDIDEIYMMGVQLISGQGGWPMSNFLMPDGKPFFAATYFPAAGFMNLLTQIAGAWQEKHAELTGSAAQVATAIDRLLSERKQVAELDPAVAETVLKAVLQREDRSFGGLGGAPKFPQEPLLLLLIDRALRNRELESLAFVERALEGMATGGIYDQVGGGFHRYSVDAQWLVPHFEKMLYTQSQLGLVYLQATRLTGNDFFRRVCAQTLDYVLRDMQLPEGGFYSATDADSEGREGTFFVWTLMQLREVLDAAEMALVEQLYDLGERGNFEGANILSLQRSLLVSARESGDPDFYTGLDGILNKLYRARELRIHPLRDDKLIVAWTAAMVTTLARAGFEFARKDWLAAAEKAAGMMWSKTVDHEATPLAVRRIYLDGKVSIAGQLEDYVNLVEALIALFDTCGDGRYLEQASSLMTATFARFWDDDNEMFYLSPPQSAGPQLTRSRSASDGATLSAVATALQCMQLLGQRAARLATPAAAEAMTAKLDAALSALSGALNEYPLSNPSLLRVLATRQRGSIEPIQYAGHGLVTVKAYVASRDENRIEATLSISVLAPWHITAPQSGKGAFVPLAIEVDEDERHWQVQECKFPAASGTLTQGAGDSIAIYKGNVEVRAQFTRTKEAADALAGTSGFLVRLQLCDEKQCLLPQELHFRV